MKYRKLRIAWSVFFGILCLLLIVLWVRSYWRADSIFWRFTHQRSISVHSNCGSLHLFYKGWQNYLGAPIVGYSASDALPDGESSHKFLLVEPSLQYAAVQLPYWSIVGTIAAIITLTSIPWPRYRFSLRTLLIGMTVVAVAVAMIVWAAR